MSTISRMPVLFLIEHYSDDSHINVGTGVDLSIHDLAEKVGHAVYPDAELVFDTSKPDGTPRKVLDVSKLRSLGWSPTVGLDDGLASTYRGSLINNPLRSSFAGSMRFPRLQAELPSLRHHDTRIRIALHIGIAMNYRGSHDCSYARDLLDPHRVIRRVRLLGGSPAVRCRTTSRTDRSLSSHQPVGPRPRLSQRLGVGAGGGSGPPRRGCGGGSRGVIQVNSIWQNGRTAPTRPTRRGRCSRLEAIGSRHRGSTPGMDVVSGRRRRRTQPPRCPRPVPPRVERLILPHARRHRTSRSREGRPRLSSSVEFKSTSTPATPTDPDLRRSLGP